MLTINIFLKYIFKEVYILEKFQEDFYGIKMKV